MRIGIPRALLYYWYGEIWESFWQDFGDVIISPPTDRNILQTGAEVAVDELCLPIKIFLGHVRALMKVSVDYIFIPHLIKVEKDAFICPKFMGLPDLVHNALPGAGNLLITKIGPREINMKQQLELTARRAGLPRRKSKELINKNSCANPGLKILSTYKINPGDQKHITIGLLGHPYCLYDSCLNLNIMEILTTHGIPFLTPEMLPKHLQGVGSKRLPKALFWTLGRRQFDALDWMLNAPASNRVQGFIHLTPFACGPEAIVGDMLERRIRNAGLPMLRLNFEEHSGEAGLLTRLEAFIDLLKYRYQAC